MPIDATSPDASALDVVDDLKGHGHDIVRYRVERGRFTDLRQLDWVRGLSGMVGDEARAGDGWRRGNGPLTDCTHAR